MALFKKVIWKCKGIEIPVEIYIERRNSFRTSVGASAILVRMPTTSSSTQQSKYLNQSKKWVTNLLEKDVAALSGITIKSIPDQYKITILGVEHTIIIKCTPSPNLLISHFSPFKHKLHLPEDNLAPYKSEIEKLLMRYFRQNELYNVAKRTHQINSETFNFKYKNVKLSLAQTRWGSCSNRTNLNFSTRLLLCPQEIIDYVIIHELAHLKEMNHSHHFWNLVERAMPSFQQAEIWLNKNNKNIRFFPY